jgi:hypothetical protein
MLPLDRALWFLTAAFSAIALARILVLRAARKQPLLSFSGMLGISLLCDIVLCSMSNETEAYTRAWAIALPARLLSHAWAAFATYRAVASLYPKIGPFAVQLFASALLVAALMCLGPLPWELHGMGSAEELLIRAMFLLYRWVDGLAAGALLLACGFLSWFPRPMQQMPSNLIRHTAMLTAYFGSTCLLFIVENLSPLGAAAWLERAHFVFVALLYAGWTLALSPQGEQSVPWESLNLDEQRLLDDRREFATALVRYAAK